MANAPSFLQPYHLLLIIIAQSLKQNFDKKYQQPTSSGSSSDSNHDISSSDSRPHILILAVFLF